MALARDQQQVLSAILSVARRRGASPMEVKAAVETGLVESNLRNLPGGDADSQGWRQERASLYANPRNLTASINRFFDETGRVKSKYGNAGDLAAAVQRPAAQYRGRYAQRGEEADRLIGRPPTRPSGGGSRQSAQTTPSQPVPQSGSPSNGQQLAALLLTQQPEPQGPRSSMGVAAPAFAAGPALPKGAMSVQSSGARQDSPGAALARSLAAVGSLGAAEGPALPEEAESPTGERAERRAASRAPSRAGAGSFKISGPNPGRLKPSLVTFAKRVAGVYGKTLTGSDGTGHSYRSATGNVSQHSTGNATDILAAGSTLLRMGRAALIAAGMPRKQAMRQTGGLYNINGHQIIFHDRRQVSGSPHSDHLHISAR